MKEQDRAEGFREVGKEADMNELARRCAEGNAEAARDGARATKPETEDHETKPTEIQWEEGRLVRGAEEEGEIAGAKKRAA